MSLTTPPQASAPPDLAGVRILLADDCEDNQYLLNRILTRKGAKVAVVGDGVDAYDRALNEPFDIVLLDIQMPLLNGFQAMAKLRAAGFAPPVLAVTGSTKDDDVKQILAAGFSAQVNKPVDPNLLMRTINETLAAHRKLN